MGGDGGGGGGGVGALKVVSIRLLSNHFHPPAIFYYALPHFLLLWLVES